MIPTRWILHDRPAKGIKARLVAQQINDGSVQDTFAATPGSVGQVLLLYIATKKKWTVCIGDVSTAFLHAPLGEGERVYVRPPANLRKAGVWWRLTKVLYSLRAAPRMFQECTAPRMFQECIEKVLREHG